MAERQMRFQEEWLSAAVDGELTAAEQAVFDQAIAADSALRREFEALQALKACVHRAAPNAEVPATLTASLVAGLDAIDAAAPAPSVGLRRWWQPALVLAGALAVVSFVLPPRPGSPSADPTPAGPSLSLDATNLAKAHRDWQAHYASLPLTEATPAQVAADISAKVGYAVAAPDTGRLRATLRGCSACGHSIPGATAAVFVMTRDDDAPMSLFEVTGEGCRIDTPGFANSQQPGVLIATVDGISLACWRAAGIHAVLAAEQSDAEDLARLAPRAVQVAQFAPHRPPRRYALLP